MGIAMQEFALLYAGMISVAWSSGFNGDPKCAEFRIGM